MVGSSCIQFKAGYLNSFERVKFSLSYPLAGRKIINQDNLLKLHGHVKTMLLTYYYKQVHT
jgi:hypothetical protein